MVIYVIFFIIIGTFAGINTWKIVVKMIKFNIEEIILFENIVILFCVTLKLWFNEISADKLFFTRLVVYADRLQKYTCIVVSYSM